MTVKNIDQLNNTHSILMVNITARPLAKVSAVFSFAIASCVTGLPAQAAESTVVCSQVQVSTHARD